MNIRSSIKLMCAKCRMVKRKGVLRVICGDKGHLQRQG